jgi:hypothetical protein
MEASRKVFYKLQGVIVRPNLDPSQASGDITQPGFPNWYVVQMVMLSKRTLRVMWLDTLAQFLGT